MSRQSLDAAYGRQGGRIVAGERPSVKGPVCPVCGGVVTSSGRTVHYVCDTSTTIGKGGASS